MTATASVALFQRAAGLYSAKYRGGAKVCHNTCIIVAGWNSAVTGRFRLDAKCSAINTVVHVLACINGSRCWPGSIALAGWRLIWGVVYLNFVISLSWRAVCSWSGWNDAWNTCCWLWNFKVPYLSAFELLQSSFSCVLLPELLLFSPDVLALRCDMRNLAERIELLRFANDSC